MANPSLVQTLVLFLLICVGYAAGKTGRLDAATAKKMSKFLVDFVLPALIVASMQKPFSGELRDQAFRMLGLSAAIYAAAFPLAYLFAKLIGTKGAERGSIIFGAVFSNCAFMGIPIIASIYGSDSIFQLSVFNIPFQVLAFSVGAFIIAKSGSGRLKLGLSSFVTPAVVATVLGFALFLANIRLPAVLTETLIPLGDMTTPLSSVIIGSVISRMDPKAFILSWRVHATALYRLTVFPLLVYAALKVAGFSGFELGMPALVFAMPVAANTTILAEAYGGDSGTASALVFVSTILSLITIPAAATFLTR